MPVILGYRLGYKQWFHTFGSRKQQQRTWLPRFSLYIVFRLTLLYRQNVSLSPKTINNKTNLLDLHKKKQQSIVVLAENRWLSNPRSIFHPGELSFLLLAKASSFYLLLKKNQIKWSALLGRKKSIDVVIWLYPLQKGYLETMRTWWEIGFRVNFWEDPLLLCHMKPCLTSDISYSRFMGGGESDVLLYVLYVPFTDEHVFNLIKSLLIRL